MIRYKKYQMTGEKSPLKGLWYARPLIEDTFDTERLAKHMANHNTPYSEGLIKGVLTDMISCTKELILDGKNVKLDDLAIFLRRHRKQKGCHLGCCLYAGRQCERLETLCTRHGRIEQRPNQSGRPTERGLQIQCGWRRVRRRKQTRRQRRRGRKPVRITLP